MEIRELIFRGFHPCDGQDTIVVDGEKVKGRWVEGHLWSKRTIGVTSPCGNLDEVVVLPSTVGQYTGLTDSNGQKVFDGDVLKFTDKPNDYKWIGRIEFGNPNGGYTWGFQIVHLNGPKPNIDTLCWFDMEEGGAYSEVIGTVFEDHEES